MTKAVLVVLVLTFGALFGWLYWSPQHTAQEFRRAAVADDTAAIVRLVDLPAVRTQFENDLQLALADACHRMADTSAFGRSTAIGRFRQAIDRTMSPAGFAAAARTGSLEPPGASLEPSQVWMTYERYPTTYLLTVASLKEGSSDTVRFLFGRDGLRWRVERLRIRFKFDNPKAQAALCR